jgi:hypothetical protein
MGRTPQPEPKPETDGLPPVVPLWSDRDGQALEESMARVRRIAERRKAREAEVVAMMRDISAEIEARKVVEELRAIGVTLRAREGTVLASPARLVNGHAAAIRKFKGAIIALLEAEAKT